MFEFLIRKGVIKRAQAAIDRLDPKVSIHVPPDLPLPSVAVIKKLAVTVSKVNALEAEIEKYADDQLKAKTDEFKKRYSEAMDKKAKELADVEQSIKSADCAEDRETYELQLDRVREEYVRHKRSVLNELLPETFAVVRETARRVVGMRHFDIQIAGGIVLHQGNIAEMATGEGKTLAATLPAYLNGITGEGVHIVTVNDYLARRDRDWMGPIYEFLGLSVGVIQHDVEPDERSIAYQCDITYGTNNEFGFDYLRDNMVNFKKDMVQRQHNFAIVDEVDSILVDEARTPLIISGPAEQSTGTYYKAYDVSKKLKGRRITEKEEIEAKMREENLGEGYDYLADEKTKAINLTEEGEVKAAGHFGVDNLHEMATIEYRHHILNALRAKEFFHCDVEYVVRDGEVIIVDEFTGRMMPGRRWSDGLHQAVEAKEGIKIERENQTLATITFQNYFRMYETLSGMTGTAYTEANEFKQIYDLDCVVMPTNRVLRRENYADCIYKTIKEKFKAVVEDIADLYESGQPVLVGTVSIEKSEYLSTLLKERGIPHQVLNAKYHELEAQIIAQAGRYKAVTIATNMAGRGTDILLGGNAEFLARSLANEKAAEGEGEQDTEALTQKFLAQFREKAKEEHEKVIEQGGLFVMATERHESRRIDNQLRGRSGRQGDPGASRFYLSLEDDLMRLFAGDRIMAIMDKLGMDEDQAIEHPLLSRSIETAQKRVEDYNFEIRKQLLEYDNVMNKQREAIYGLRRSILESEDVKDLVRDAISHIVDASIEQFLVGSRGEDGWDLDGLALYLKTNFNFSFDVSKEKLVEIPADGLRDIILEGITANYVIKEQEIGVERLRHLERMLMLHTIDAKWKDHLYAMDQLRESVGLRSYGQRDPLMEYKREGFEMFQMMFASIHQEVAETIFKVQPVKEHERIRGVFSSLPQNFLHADFSGMSQAAQRQAQQPQPPQAPGQPPREESRPAPIRKDGPKVGRNDPCPCGSGRKYKKCCGR